MTLTADLVRERVRGTILESIGDTPLVPLRRIGAGLRGELWAKFEAANPGGSVKDRAALWMVIAAEEEGLLRERAFILDATSGNTGIALAMVCAVRGHPARRVTHFVAGVGTSGTIVGVSAALRPRGVRIVAVQPDNAFHGIDGWKHMPTALRPAIWDERAADEHRVMATDEATAKTKRLAREE